MIEVDPDRLPVLATVRSPGAGAGHPRPRRLLATLLATTMALGACTGLKAVPHADAIRMVERYRDLLPGIVGDGTTVENPGSDVSPCDGDEHGYAATAHGQLSVPAERRVAALERLKGHFTQQGWKIRDELTYDPDKGGRLRVTNPVDETTVRIEIGAPPVLYTIRVSSPCYRSDEPV